MTAVYTVYYIIVNDKILPIAACGRLVSNSISVAFTVDNPLTYHKAIGGS